MLIPGIFHSEKYFFKISSYPYYGKHLIHLHPPPFFQLGSQHPLPVRQSKIWYDLEFCKIQIVQVRFYHFEQQVTGVYGLKPYYGKGRFIHLLGKINIGKTLKWEIMVRKKWGLDKSITLTNQLKLG